MKTTDKNRTSPRLTAWLVVLIFFGWLAFVFVPWPRSETKETRLAPVDARAPYRAKLLAVGLPDNPDLDGLPEIFAIWADKAYWKNDRTKFAYWNPGSQDYTYFFEAIRENGRVRFRPISRPWEYDVEFGPHAPPPDEHPLRLMPSLAGKGARSGPAPRSADSPGPRSEPGQVPVDLPPPRFKPDAPAVHLEVVPMTESAK